MLVRFDLVYIIIVICHYFSFKKLSSEANLGQQFLALKMAKTEPAVILCRMMI